VELFAVWACKGGISAQEYIGQIHILLGAIEQAPLGENTIVTGDFNSNSIWDSVDGVNNHSAAVERFRKLGLQSAYHVFSGDSQGAERQATHWNMKQRTAAYHIDYAFLSQSLVSKLRNVELGGRDDWLSISDHASMLVELT
jgi:endonuclease/exonuclease/phosphatase family metal-dependent hydrolase